MIIILEGPDGSGKSTLAHAVASLLGGATVVSSGPPIGDPFNEYMEKINEARLRPTHTIFDRLHVGELVYGPLLRGRSRLTAADAFIIEGTLNALCASGFHCTAPTATLKARLLHRDGGMPDKKSGARPDQSEDIRVKFAELLGERQSSMNSTVARAPNSGSLNRFGVWETLDMRTDHTLLAKHVERVARNKSQRGFTA